MDFDIEKGKKKHFPKKTQEKDEKNWAVPVVPALINVETGGGCRRRDATHPNVTANMKTRCAVPCGLYDGRP